MKRTGSTNGHTHSVGASGRTGSASGHTHAYTTGRARTGTTNGHSHSVPRS